MKLAVPVCLLAIGMMFGVVTAAPEDRFQGGGFDGAASGRATAYAPPAPGSLGRFVGGGGYDGYASSALAGYAPPLAGSQGRFVGGGGHDGYASGGVAGYIPPLAGALGRFRGGGGYDGYSSSRVVGYVPPVPGSQGRFVGGGGYDGWAMWTVTGIPNPLSGDADLDQVPDWWEAEHYGSIVRAGNDTDLDGDHIGSYDEYVADTDPNDKASWFRVLGMGELDGVLRVDVGSSSPHRVYALEVSHDLLPDGWLLADPVAGNGGTLTLESVVFWDDRTFARVILSMP